MYHHGDVLDKPIVGAIPDEVHTTYTRTPTHTRTHTHTHTHARAHTQKEVLDLPEAVGENLFVYPKNTQRERENTHTRTCPDPCGRCARAPVMHHHRHVLEKPIVGAIPNEVYISIYTHTYTHPRTHTHTRARTYTKGCLIYLRSSGRISSYIKKKHTHTQRTHTHTPALIPAAVVPAPP